MVDKLQSTEVCKGEIAEVFPAERTADATLTTVVAVVGLVDYRALVAHCSKTEGRSAILVVDILGERECIEEVATEEMGANIRRTLVDEI